MTALGSSVYFVIILSPLVPLFYLMLLTEFILHDIILCYLQSLFYMTLFYVTELFYMTLFYVTEFILHDIILCYLQSLFYMTLFCVTYGVSTMLHSSK